MQKASTILAVVLSFVLLFLIHFGWMYYKEDGVPAGRRIELKVLPGSTLSDVQVQLEEKGLLRYPTVFRWAAILSGRERKIKTGRYIFRLGESASSILGKLVGGEVDYTRVVIPEGLMVREIAGSLQVRVEIDSTAFYNLTMDTAVARKYGIDAPSLEGYLFPDTYLFSWPLTPQDVIDRMVHRFFEVYDDSMRSVADSLGFSMNEAVTLASIIQGEAVFDSEMTRISAVYHNRLKRRWRLEADPTVAYALGGVRRRLMYKDLRVKSPYNTYRHRGLPPGPICSPGLAALFAALQPLKGSKELYFVADGSGRHLFTKTLDEHLEAKRRIKYESLPWTRDLPEPERELKPLGAVGEEKEEEGQAKPQDN